MASAPEKASSSSSSTLYDDIVCIGAGMSGVGLGAQLQRKYNSRNIHFYEKNGEVGGTWWVNTYPGCACDVPSALYSYSFAPNPNWTRFFPESREIMDYVLSVAEKYRLRQLVTFQSEVYKCEWDDARERWRVYVKDLKTGNRYTHECKVLFTAIGVLERPRECTIPGKDSFQGALFHSARWDHSVSLKDKNVVLLGNGCTATQILPAIAPEVKHVTQFFKTNHWMLKVPDVGADGYPNWAQWAFKHVPGALLLHRFTLFVLFESRFPAFYLTPKGAKMRKQQEEEMRQHLKEKAPQKYQESLMPTFDIGCKRRILERGYFNALHRDNVSLKNEKVLEILPDGVRTAQGTYPADVIVLATGFQTRVLMSELEIYGKNGEELHEHWKKNGGPGAYNTTSVSGFPNMFMLLGPNTAPGHTSALYGSELAVDYALRVLKPVILGRATQVDVKLEAEKKDIAETQQGLRKRVWNAGCGSWYVEKADAWNALNYPWNSFWWLYKATFPAWGDWNIKRQRRRSSNSTRNIIILLLALGLPWAVVNDSRLGSQLGVQQLVETAKSSVAELLGGWKLIS